MSVSRQQSFFQNAQRRVVWIGIWFLVLGAASAWGAPRFSAEIIRTLPHDATSFTQGLLVYNGKLYESTGLYGQSRLRRIDPETGTVEQEHSLSQDVFGEGLALYKDHLFQLTWRAGKVYEYNVQDFKSVATWPLPTEGWGATVFNDMIVVSDGSNQLGFYDPKTFQPVTRVDVKDGADPVEELNELETFCGYILANIWYKNEIALINPMSGQVVAWIDLSFLLGVLPQKLPPDAVLNGIAYDSTQHRLYVTGKLWPKIYVIAVKELDALTDNQCRTLESTR